MNHNSYPINRKYLTLFFKHNSARSTGSTVFGGHLNECRLYYRTKLSYNLDPICGNKQGSYTDDALGAFMNLSTIINHEESVTNISSPAKSIKLCETLQDMHMYSQENNLISS